VSAVSEQVLIRQPLHDPNRSHCRCQLPIKAARGREENKKNKIVKKNKWQILKKKIKKCSRCGCRSPSGAARGGEENKKEKEVPQKRRWIQKSEKRSFFLRRAL